MIMDFERKLFFTILLLVFGQVPLRNIAKFVGTILYVFVLTKILLCQEQTLKKDIILEENLLQKLWHSASHLK